MRQFISLLCIILFLHTAPIAQTTLRPYLLENLVSDTIAIKGVIIHEGLRFVEIPHKPFDEYPQGLLKNEKGLFLFLNGTGRLYKAQPGESGIQFERIDSTRHFGYNIGCFYFSYRDTIYNLGGYGLWRINGQLRKYVERTRQWDIVKLNRELPLMYDKLNTLMWYDETEGNIYTGISISRDEAVRDSSLDETKFTYDVSILDLETKSWTKLGNLSTYLRERIPLLENLTSSPWGQIVFSGNKFMLVDFKRNNLLTLKADIADRISNTLAPHEGKNAFFFKDSILFAAGINSDKIDSFSLSKSDFELFSGTGIYDLVSDKMTHRNKSTNLIYYLILFLIIAFLLVLYFFRRKSIEKKRNDKNLMDTKPMSSETTSVVFDEREREVLHLIYTNSVIAMFTSIEEINKTLGIGKRNMEIQKKQRSDVISSINRKFAFMYQETETVLEKRRSESDGRSFEYYIKPDQITRVKNILTEISTADSG